MEGAFADSASALSADRSIERRMWCALETEWATCSAERRTTVAGGMITGRVAEDSAGATIVIRGAASFSITG